jgi:hypothetical protein
MILALMLAFLTARVNGKATYQMEMEGNAE